MWIHQTWMMEVLVDQDVVKSWMEYTVGSWSVGHCSCCTVTVYILFKCYKLSEAYSYCLRIKSYCNDEIIITIELSQNMSWDLQCWQRVDCWGHNLATMQLWRRTCYVLFKQNEIKSSSTGNVMLVLIKFFVVIEANITLSIIE
jgi:hypothetical protein